MFPRTFHAFTLMLIASSGIADARPADTDALRFQQNLIAVLECRATPTERQALGSQLRAARYGVATERPAHLRGWRFIAADHPEIESAATRIELPAPITANGITTGELLADDLGLGMSINAVQRDRIVAEDGLQMRTSTLHEPFRVWWRPSSDDAAAAQAWRVIRSEGAGNRLSCDYRERYQKLDDQQAADRLREDLVAVLECRADTAAWQRFGEFWTRVSAHSPLGWPAQVRALDAPACMAREGGSRCERITLDAPISVHGLAVSSVMIEPSYASGHVAADLGMVPVDDALQAAIPGATAAGEIIWTLPAAPLQERPRERFVVRTADGRTLMGCATSKAIHSGR
ncbi:hypothetical protein DFO63_1674 [Stenotrophomonas sp. AG209]|nr:hypothetical protein DFO63_1674 [Stenotrophomonas sp. AG209]